MVLLLSLSWVASEKLQTNTTVLAGDAFVERLRTRGAHRTLILWRDRTEGWNVASSFPVGFFGGALLVDITVCLRLSSAALLLGAALVRGAGLSRDTRFALCREEPNPLSLSQQVQKVLLKEEQQEVIRVLS